MDKKVFHLWAAFCNDMTIYSSMQQWKVIMNRLWYIFRYCLCGALAIIITLMDVPAMALEQAAVPRILNLSVEKASENQMAVILKTTGVLDLSRNPFVLSKPNRIVFDFQGALPGSQLKASCKKASTPQIAIRSGRHQYYTRIVLDFGDRPLPNYRLSQRLGVITIRVETPSQKIKEQVVEVAPAQAAVKKDDASVDLGDDSADITSSEHVAGVSNDLDEEAIFEDHPSDEDGQAQEGLEEDGSLLEDEFDVPGEEGASDSPLHFSGSIQNKYSHDADENGAFESDALNHFEALAKVAYDNDGILRVEIGVDVDAYADENDGDWDNDNDVRLYEAYVNLSFSTLNLRVGNQIVRWGKSDGFSPLDNINPEDLRGGVAGRREERKIPIPMANLEADFFGMSWQGIYIPGFYKSDFDIVGTDWSLFGHSDRSVGPFAYQEEEHDELFDSQEYGLRISSTVGNFDYAFSYLHTRSDTPVLGSMTVPGGFPLDLENGGIRDIVAFAIATGQIIPIGYERQNIYGFEFETTVGDFGLRGDVAYFAETYCLTEDLDQIEKPALQYTLGADYISPTDFYINLQFSHSIILDYEEAIVFQEENAYSVNGTISQELLNGDLKLELRGFYDLTGNGTMLNPQVIISPWESLALEFGAEFFGGTQQTVMGMFDDNDQYYGKARYKF